ncbi:MAG: peroxiredoxin [Verrucomicrobiae bacterium]|nr:peroxiredoxin [Verrucomicrobiae bacterium]
MKKLPLFLTAALICLAAPSAKAEPLNVGDAAPTVKTTDQNGKEVDLGKELASGTALVYFYPKADTPGCTKQACNLRDEFEAVTKAGIKVFGVSADTEEDQKKFEVKYTLPFTLLADKKGEVIKAFGVPTINDKGMSARQSFLIRDGKVIWRDLKANPTSQAQDAIAAAAAAK